MPKKVEKINQNTTLEEILAIAGAEKILIKYNLPCLFCPMATFEIKSLKLGDVCKTYGIDAKKVIEEINNLLKGRKNKKIKNLKK